MRMNELSWATAAALTFSLSGCGGSGSGSGAAISVPMAGPMDAANASKQPLAASLPVTWQLVAGAASANQAFQGLDFYPSAITIDAGDSITWTSGTEEPHTITFLGPRKSLPPPNDPSAPLPAGGSTYDGSVYTSSGFIFKGQRYTLKFTKSGVYPFFCIIHPPEMAGVVTVHAAGDPYPQTQAQITELGTAQADADVLTADTSIRKFPFESGGLHVAAGFGPTGSSAQSSLRTEFLVGPAGAATVSTSTVLRFINTPTLKDTMAAHLRDTMVFTNLSANEPHTVTFTKGGAPPPPSLSPFAPPSGGNTVDGTKLVNSGPLFPGQSFKVTFTKTGTFTYYCLFHDGEGMIAKVSVH